MPVEILWRQPPAGEDPCPYPWPGGLEAGAWPAGARSLHGPIAAAPAPLPWPWDPPAADLDGSPGSFGAGGPDRLWEQGAAAEPAPSAARLGHVGLGLLCRGVVQGVGFRPAVGRLAASLRLDGCLSNVAGAVRLDLAGPRPSLERFLEQLPAALLPPARLERIEACWLPLPLPQALRSGSGLRLGASPPEALGEGWFARSLSADLAPCPECLAELLDPASRRFRYPFLSCSRCGPRYSIATAEPWCRAHTTLAAFPPCPACRREFEDPSDRRFHAETIACPRCGPRLSLELAAQGGAGFRPHAGCDPLQGAAALLRGGGILALQGVGGFQLLVDASDARAVQRLRRRKRRPGRPFALLVADERQLEPLVQLDPLERHWLRHPAAPIVLLRRRRSAAMALPGVAPGSAALGVMLSASPLHHLLALAVGRPLVCTSGNRSGEPLCLDPAEACERLAGIADGVLHHDRPIARRLDDSLLQLVAARPSLLRRARGFCPEPLPFPAGCSSGALPDRPVLALGGDLKSAPALARGDRCWLAPHLGDLGEPRSQQRLRLGLEEQRRRQGADLCLACDAHPGYLSQQLAASTPLPLRRVPHHLAHGLAVLAEHGLQAPLLLVAFDGLGYGDPAEDGGGLPRLRGGEVLLLEPAAAGGLKARTVASLRPFALPGAERAMREPRRSALGLLHGCGLLEHPGAWRLRQAFPAADRELLLQALRADLQAPLCSSAGRLFDAAASLLGLVQVLRYEGEGGLKLQGAAQRGLDPDADPPRPGLLLRPRSGQRHLELDWQPLLEGVLRRSLPGGDRRRTAAWFHLALAEGLAACLEHLCHRHQLPCGGDRVALSGGCFQNRLLLEASASALARRGLGCRWSEAVPCNDGGLALGQLWAVRQGLAAGDSG